MENESKILQGHSDLEKGAYLGAIASIATADREASEEELEYIGQLCAAADLSDVQKQSVIRAATEMSGEELTKCLDVLKNSDLKYSLVADLITFAKADNEYSEAEQQNVQKIAQYLGVNQKQFSLLDQFADKASSSTVTPEEASKPSFLSSLGLGDQMQNAGINSGGFLKGLLGIAAPMILTGMLTRGLGRRGGMGGGLFGGGGLFPGGGGMFGGGGLGSIIGMLSGGRRFRNTGGLFGRIFGGGF
jgi:uncharacterized tellurite resistance protein B-like protein